MQFTSEQLKQILDGHKIWLESDFTKGKQANLQYADLRYADLRSANLRSANLRSADLRFANLRSADLRSAYLRSAYLRSADLRSADLRFAYLRSANLRSANLQSADLRSANITGEIWQEYINEIIPTLLQAGGKTLQQVLSTNCWSCHSWENCPMAEAFNVKSLKDVPKLLKTRVEQFVLLFDLQGNIIPEPKLDADGNYIPVVFAE